MKSKEIIINQIKMKLKMVAQQASPNFNQSAEYIYEIFEEHASQFQQESGQKGVGDEEIEKAAYTYGENAGFNPYTKYQLDCGFKAGAKWMREQIKINI